MVWFVNRMAGLGKGLGTQALPALSLPTVCVKWASRWADCSQALGPVWSSCGKTGTEPKDRKPQVSVTVRNLCSRTFPIDMSPWQELAAGRHWEEAHVLQLQGALCCVKDASVGGRELSFLPLPRLCLVGRLFCSAFLFPGMQVITVWVLIVSNCYWVVVILAYGKWKLKCSNSKSFTVIRHS